MAIWLSQAPGAVPEALAEERGLARPWQVGSSRGTSHTFLGLRDCRRGGDWGRPHAHADTGLEVSDAPTAHVPHVKASWLDSD